MFIKKSFVSSSEISTKTIKILVLNFYRQLFFRFLSGDRNFELDSNENLFAVKCIKNTYFQLAQISLELLVIIYLYLKLSNSRSVWTIMKSDFEIFMKIYSFELLEIIFILMRFIICYIKYIFFIKFQHNNNDSKKHIRPLDHTVQVMNYNCKFSEH